MNKNPVNGMRDILPKEMELRTYVLGVIRDTYRTYGFTEMETPIVESIENLTGKNGGENEKLTFQILKRGEKLDLESAHTVTDVADSGLRYDLTMPLSRYYAAHNAELMKPFRALQIGPVFRAERPQKGRYREFYQCDIDILGDSTNHAEIELILATTAALTKLGFKDVVIRMNDRRILKAMVRHALLEDADCDNLFITLDKMDKIGADGVREALRNDAIPDAAIDTLLSLFQADSDENDDARLNRFAAELFGDPDAPVIRNLKQIFTVVNAAKESGITLRFDPTLVRGMGYYTGPIFEIAVPEFSSSVGGGGRYDEMVGRFIGQNTPACGFSIGFERIVQILLDRNTEVPGSTEKTAILLEKGLSDVKRAEAFRKANELRAAGKTVLTAVMAKNKKFQKEQLEAEGFHTILEVFEAPLER